MDKRIGNSGYYKPGLGISGGNIERDIQTLNKITIKNKINNKLPKFYIKSNNYSRNWVNKIILEQKIKNKKISILGATYKENTLSTKNGIQIDLLNKYKSKVMMHDFKSKNLIDTKKHLGMTINYKSLEHNLQKSNIVIIFHNINLYKKIKFYKYKNIKCLIDPYNIADVKNIKNIKHYKLIK